MPCGHSPTSTQRIKTSLIIKHSHLKCSRVLKKRAAQGQTSSKVFPKILLNVLYYHKHPHVSLLAVNARAASCGGMLGVNHVQVEMSERDFQTGLPWNRWEPWFMWLISLALALRSEGADQSPAERAFSLHTEEIHALAPAHKGDSCCSPLSELFSA